jgi:hypothetical protein
MLYRAIRKSNAHGFAFANSLASSASLSVNVVCTFLEEAADEFDAVSAVSAVFASSIREGVVFVVVAVAVSGDFDRSSSEIFSV